MRVGIMTPGLSKGDAVSNDAAGMYATLQAEGYATYLFTPSGETSTELPVHRYADLRWLLDKADDCVIYHYCTADQLALNHLRRLTCGIVVKYHNVTPSYYMAPYSSAFTQGTKEGRRGLMDLADMRVDHFLADSTFNANELMAFGVAANKLWLLPPFNAVEDLLALPDDPAVRAVLNEHTFNLLAVGRVVPNKGLDLMLDSLAGIAGSGLRPHLHIVGGHDDRLSGYLSHLRTVVKQRKLSDYVTFHGTLGSEAIATFFRYCDLFWTTSQHEGFCVPAVEAMAFGKAILATPHGALRETCGDVARFADTVGEHSDRLLEMLKDDTARVLQGRLGRRRYEEVFNHSHTQARFIEFVRWLERHRSEIVAPESVDVGTDWFGLPQGALLAKAAMHARREVHSLALTAQDGRLDLLYWALTVGRKQSEEIAAYFRQPSLHAYASSIAVPRSASRLSPMMRLSWFFSRYAQATFDLTSQPQVAAYQRWFLRMARKYDLFDLFTPTEQRFLGVGWLN